MRVWADLHYDPYEPWRVLLRAALETWCTYVAVCRSALHRLCCAIPEAWHHSVLAGKSSLCVCVCVRACVRAWVRAWVRACARALHKMQNLGILDLREKYEWYWPCSFSWQNLAKINIYKIIIMLYSTSKVVVEAVIRVIIIIIIIILFLDITTPA